MNSMDMLMDGGIEVSHSGFFSEAAEALDAIDSAMQMNLMKGQMIAESVEREYDLNIAQAELKCMKERGSADDLMYLEEAASEGAAAKLKKIIDRIIQIWKDFCTSIRNKVMSKICSAEARQTLTKAEKKIKINPILARKKVEVININRPLGVINKYRSQVDKQSAKIIKGIVSETTAKTLGDTRDEFRAAFNKSIAGSAAVKMITVAAVVTELNSCIEKLPKLVDTCENTHTIVLDKLKATVSDDTAAAATAMTQACMNFRTELAKEELNQHFAYTMDLMSALKKAVIKVKGKAPVADPELKAESADDYDILSDNEIFEGTEDWNLDDDSDLYESYDENDEYEESYEESDDDFIDRILAGL